MIYVIAWLLSAIVGAIIGFAKGRPAAGAMWGLLLGPLGWFVLVSVPDTRPKCPECFGAVVVGARKCMHCGSSLKEIDALPNRSPYRRFVFDRTWKDFTTAAITVSIIGGATYIWWKNNKEAAATVQTYQQYLDERAAKNITLSDYRRLTPRISYSEACQILGKSGTEISHSRLDRTSTNEEPLETISYSWANSDGSNLILLFQNNQLVSRTQYGLQ